MADVVVSPVAPAAGAPAASASPAPLVDVAAAAAPIVAPIVDALVVAPAVETPVVAPVVDDKKADALAADAKPADAKVADAKPDDAKPDPAQAAEPPKDGEAKPEPAAAETPKAPEFKIPEGMTADAPTMAAFSNVLGKYNISPEAGQELIDFHANLVKSANEQATQHQQDYFAQTQKDWVADFDKSSGNRRDTVLNDAKFAISDTIKDAKERQAVWDVLSFTGAGNHKHVINALAKIGKRLRESTGEKQGAPNNAARGGSPAERRYGPKS